MERLLNAGLSAVNDGCEGRMEEMYDSQGNLSERRWTAILPELTVGKQYSIYAVYNVSVSGKNRVVIHITDDEHDREPSVVPQRVDFVFTLSMVTDARGAEPIDKEKSICVGILHENDTSYFRKIEEFAFRVFEATRDRQLCDRMTYRELFGDETPENHGDPKKCGGGLILQ